MKIHIGWLCSSLYVKLEYVCQVFLILGDNALVTYKCVILLIIMQLLWKENIMRQYYLRTETVSIYLVEETVHQFEIYFLRKPLPSVYL